MTRSRSKSVVQRIAQDVAEHHENLPVLEESTQCQSSSSRLRAINDHNNHSHEIRTPSGLSRTVSKDENLSKLEITSFLDPFTAKEKHQLWQRYTNEFSHDIIIPNEQIESIQALTDNSALIFQSKCLQNIENVNILINQTNNIIDQIHDLSSKYTTVSHDTSDFALKSQDLMDKKNNLQGIADDIEQNLQVFESLDSITKILTSPGLNIVKKKSFFETLIKLDSCLTFISQHEDYKEADTFKVRFRQCMTRSLTLIRNYLIEDLKDFQKKVTTKLTNSLKTKSSISSFSFDIFLYTEFNEHLKVNEGNEYYSFPNLITEIHKRIENHSEYLGLFNEVQNQYFKLRSSLLNDYVWNQLDEAEAKFQNDDNMTLVQFTQNNISFYEKLLTQELDLYCKYFNIHGKNNLNQELTEWFKSILEPLYDTLRNRIIREINIGVLCELATLLQKYHEFEDINSEQGSMIVGNNSVSSGIDFAKLFEPIFLDTQRRLIFRIQLYVDDKLIKYKATPQDLQLGNRARSISNLEEGNRSNSKVNPLDVEFSENLFENWFLPIGKALTILSNIYELINSAVFDDIAHYIVHSCIYMLKHNVYQLAKTHLGETDAKLYLLKNLILLQEQLNNFDIQYVRTETSLDFTSGINEIFESIRTSGMKSLDILDVLRKSVPKVVNDMIDAKREVQTELSNLVADFVEGIVKDSESCLDVNNPLKSSLAFRDNISTGLPKIYKAIDQYLHNPQVGQYLMESVKNLLMSSFEEFYTKIDSKRGISQQADKELSEVMEPDTFYGFLEEISMESSS